MSKANLFYVSTYIIVCKETCEPKVIFNILVGLGRGYLNATGQNYQRRYKMYKYGYKAKNTAFYHEGGWTLA